MISHNSSSNKYRIVFYLTGICVFTLFWMASFFNLRITFAASGDPVMPSLACLADEVKHSVVNISTTQVLKGVPLEPFFGPNSPFWDLFKGDMPQRNKKTHSLGSGLVIDNEGHILTNNHVLEKAKEIKVKLHSGKEYDAIVIGRDAETDLALIKTTPDPDFPKPARLGDSNSIRVGDWVMAIGNPLGLGHTVTVGIISGKGRFIGAGPYDDFLQTDTAINPGNSGGPLFNMQGDVVGINSVLVEEGQGISFAVPVNLVRELLPQLKSGRIVRGWLGVKIQDVTPRLIKYFGLKETKGALIADIIIGSPAESSGLKRGDFIFRYNGKEVKNAQMLSRLLADTAPGSQVKIDVIRNRIEKTFTIGIGSVTEEEAEQQGEEEIAWGFSIQDITPELAQDFILEEGDAGVLISNVAPGTPADESGIQVGDLIREINRREIQNLDDAIRIIRNTKKSDNLLLLIKRQDGTFYVVLDPASEK